MNFMRKVVGGNRSAAVESGQPATGQHFGPHAFEKTLRWLQANTELYSKGIGREALLHATPILQGNGNRVDLHLTEVADCNFMFWS